MFSDIDEYKKNIYGNVLWILGFLSSDVIKVFLLLDVFDFEYIIVEIFLRFLFFISNFFKSLKCFIVGSFLNSVSELFLVFFIEKI